jgi:crotonobetainyl-CoA:carnitine CoA-transferase CaiB-like acyl-CoA transferase
MFDSMISAMTTNYMIYLGSGDIPSPLGTSYLPIVPYRAFATKDTDIAIAVGSEKLWRAFGPALGHTELVNHPAYATNSLRVQNRGQLEPLLSGIFLRDTMKHWLTKLREAGIPASPVRRFDEVANDAQSAVRGMFPRIELPEIGKVRVIGTPIKSFEPATGLINAPRLGEHTRETLTKWLGMQGTELSDLQSAGVILQANKE